MATRTHPEVCTKPLWSGFVRSAKDFANRTALRVQGETIPYGELGAEATRIAATIQARTGQSSSALTAILAYRSKTAFSGVLGSLLAGNGYVPLNPTFPIERTQLMLELSECRSLIVDSGSFDLAAKLFDSVSHSMVVILPDLANASEYASRWPQHEFADSRHLENGALWREVSPSADSMAYLLFTSGSTGTPKGVMVAQRNVNAFVEYMIERYGITEQDRLSQMFDMTFDLSAFDMFMAWERGACLCCPSRKETIQPSAFIRNEELSVWFSVPSTKTSTAA